MIVAPMEFNYTKLFFTIELERDISDPYLFFGIRRDFTEIFRKTVGCRGFEDEKCPSAGECPYEELFSQEMNADPYVVKRFQKPPLPFVFDPPLLPSAPNRGIRVEIGLKLAGKAVNHILYFIEAIRSMFDRRSGGKSGVAGVIRIESADYFGNRMLVFEDG